MGSIFNYFKRLYKYNKLLFSIILFFALLQLGLTFKKGVLFSPWFKFGMYSQVLKIKDTYRVNKVDNLKGSDFTAQQWDKIHWTLTQYQLHEKSDSIYENGIKPFFNQIHLYIPQKSIYYLSVDSANFSHWYYQYISKMMGISPKQFQIETNVYKWNGEILQKIN